MARTRKPDVRFIDHGSIVLMFALTRAAKAWVAENVGEHQTFGPAVVVEPRYVPAIAEGMISDGLSVRVA